MKIQHLILTLFFLVSLSACNFDKKVNQMLKDEIAKDTGATFSDEETVSLSKASLAMTIDGKDVSNNCDAHYLNIAKETYGGDYSYSFRANIRDNKEGISAFQLSFRSKEKFNSYEVELDFKKSSTGNKLKTFLTVYYFDDEGKSIQTTQDVGKVIITKMTEEEITMEVDTKLLLIKTVNLKGEGKTVHLKGTVTSSNPIITMLNGAKKEEVF